MGAVFSEGIRFTEGTREGFDGEGGARPPMVVMDSASSSSLSGPSSPSKSLSKIVFRLAGGGREASEDGFFVILRPYDSVDIPDVGYLTDRTLR